MKEINYKKIKEICINPTKSFEKYGKIKETVDGILIHKDNGSNILAVAHLDTVQSKNFFYKSNGHIFNPQLDDRLGAYIILELLPKLGIKTDILLTEGEEMGRSTAAYFENKKQYNWIFSFDRAGSDVVLYDYDSHSMRKRLKKYGFKIGIGSFSDICWLENLNCKGINFGCGYYDNHSVKAYAIMDELIMSVQKFINFYNSNYNKHFQHKESKHPFSSYNNSFYGHSKIGYTLGDYGDFYDRSNKSTLDVVRDYKLDNKIHNNNTSRCDECHKYLLHSKSNSLGLCSSCLEDIGMLCVYCNNILINETEILNGACIYCQR